VAAGLGTDSKAQAITIPDESQPPQKAAKHDDAKVPVHLWNERVRKDSHLKLDDRELDCVQACLLAHWKKRVAKGFAENCK
jgi:hypothetical protein